MTVDAGIEPSDWFLTAAERGNSDTVLDTRHADGASWTSGNEVRPLVHGAEYFGILLHEVGRMEQGDLLLFTDWRGDADERLDGPGTDVGLVFAAAARRGVDVRGLLWRSHLTLQYASIRNRGIGEQIERAGGQVLLDMRVAPFGSHHQKLVVIRHRNRPEDDVAFVGGIDLCHSRRDDSAHEGDPQGLPMAKVYGPHPPWHDIQLMIKGPAVGDVEAVFRERWDDPAALSRHPVHLVSSWVNRETKSPDPLPDPTPDPPVAGTVAVQLLRTYPSRWRGYPYARDGERSIAKGYVKALARAKSLVYVEDQYLWSAEVAEVYADALRKQSSLRVVFVIPGFPEQDGRMFMPPNQLGRAYALDVLRRAGGDRFAVYWLENGQGTPIYVHAKVCIVDDRWACIGSDNANRRSWTHDSELSAAFVEPDGQGEARRLRVALANEHVGGAFPDDRLRDPDHFFSALANSAKAIDEWHAGGQVGTRPNGHLRRFNYEIIPRWTRLWADPLYRIVFDPDGRSRRMRRHRAF